MLKYYKDSLKAKITYFIWCITKVVFQTVEKLVC